MKMQIKSVKVQFDKLLGETPAAYLLRFGMEEIWIPRKLAWKMVVNNKLGGNLVIPTWLYKEKFGEDPDTSMADTIIEKHTPARIEPIKTDPDASLTR
jgi:hypothetical protein